MAIHYLVVDQQTDAQQYLEPLWRLTKEVFQTNNAPYLYPLTKAFYQDFLGLHMSKIFAFDGDKLVGCSVLKHLQTWPDYLVDHKPAGVDCAEVGQLLFTILDPHYRGQGLGNALYQYRIDTAIVCGIKHLYSTVHPDNEPSMKLQLQHQMECIYQGLVFDEQLLRCVMYRKLAD